MHLLIKKINEESCLGYDWIRVLSCDVQFDVGEDGLPKSWVKCNVQNECTGCEDKYGYHKTLAFDDVEDAIKSGSYQIVEGQWYSISESKEVTL